MEEQHFEGIMDMVDGSHIETEMPCMNGIDYWNRQDFW